MNSDRLLQDTIHRLNRRSFLGRTGTAVGWARPSPGSGKSSGNPALNSASMAASGRAWTGVANPASRSPTSPSIGQARTGGMSSKVSLFSGAQAIRR